MCAYRDEGPPRGYDHPQHEEAQVNTGEHALTVHCGDSEHAWSCQLTRWMVHTAYKNMSLIEAARMCLTLVEQEHFPVLRTYLVEIQVHLHQGPKCGDCN